jgi:hypothetical protein
VTNTVRTFLLVSTLFLATAFANAQTCTTPVAQMITPADGSTLQVNPATGLVDFTWCNASADYFVTIETLPGAHDLFFAFAGGPAAGVTTLSLGPSCAAAFPKGCIPQQGEHITFILQTVKNKQIIGTNQYSFTAPSSAAARPDFTVSSSKPSVTIAVPGGTASTVLTITGQAGYNGIVSFACTGLPANSSCAFDPATIAGGGTTTMTITTTPSASLRAPRLHWLATVGGVSFAGLWLAGVPGGRRSRRGRAWLMVFLLGALLMIGGCGGSTSSSATTTVRSTGTPAGTTTVTVAASDGTLTHTMTMTVTVQ